MPKKTLTKFDNNLSTLLIGVDSLFGGDALHESGTKHMIADTWTSGFEPPSIYHDPISRHLRVNGGMENFESSTIVEYLIKYDLLELPDVIREEAASFERDRKTYMNNLVSALEVMLNSYSKSYEEKYMTATTLDEVKLIDPTEGKDSLRKALAKSGYGVTNSRNLRETYLAWVKDEGYIPPDQIAKQANTTIRLLFQLTREKIFPHLNVEIKGYNEDLSDVTFDGHRFETLTDEDFTGSSIYQGGEENGNAG